MFSGNRINPSGNVIAPSSFLNYPVAQGAEVFNYTSNGNQLTLGENGLAITQTEIIPVQEPVMLMSRSIAPMSVAPLTTTITSGIAFNAVGFQYDNGTTVNQIPWGNLQQKISAVAPISAALNTTTLAINNALSIQDGETIQGSPDSAPTPNILLTSASGVNRIALSGDYGSAGNVLTSGGNEGTLYWGTGTVPGSVGTLGEVLNNGVNGNVASKNIDMDGYSIDNLAITATPASTTISTNCLPLTINGITYYVQLFTSP
jgi:hypothetical protein